MTGREGAARGAWGLHRAGEDPARGLRSLLERELERPVEVRFGRSRGHPVVARGPSAREARADPRLAARGLVVRLHEVFRTAPEAVHHDLARWLRVGGRARAASARLDRWIEDALDALPQAPLRELRIATRGRVHDLELLTRRLVESDLQADFASRPVPTVSWGERRITGARRTLRLGSYEPARHLVRIHPVLDQPAVPELYVRSVLFHELLHAALPVRKDAAGCWIHHPPEFRRRERAHPDHAAALAFERRHLSALLRSTRTGFDLAIGSAASSARAEPVAARRPARAAGRPARDEGPGLFD